MAFFEIEGGGPGRVRARVGGNVSKHCMLAFVFAFAIVTDKPRRGVISRDRVGLQARRPTLSGTGSEGGL